MSKTSKHEEKMINLQYQMRENQAELQDFLKDLDNWESDIKQKDVSLKSQKPNSEPVLPPVRNSLNKKKVKKKKKEESDQNGVKAKRIHSYDYRAWDKFDVDKALEEMEEGEEKSSSEYETDEEWEMERKKHLAIQEKDKGNEHFNKGELELAIECYTRGVELDPTNSVLPANRAMAQLKLGRFGAAEMDCTMALSLDPLYIKAFLRRASARVGLQKYEQAKEDYEKVLKLEPQNKKAKSELENIEKEINRKNTAATPASTVNVENTGIVKPIYKPPEQRSKKPLRKIEIEEIGVDDGSAKRAEIAKAQASQSALKKQITAQDNRLFEKLVTSGGTDTKDKTVSSRADVTSGPNNDGDKAVQSRTVSNSVDTTSSSDQRKSLGKKELSTPDSRLASDNAIQVDTDSSAEREVPQTSYQFQADYKILKNKPQAFYKYFKRIDPSSYPKLFGQAFDADILIKIVTILQQFYLPNQDDYLTVLQNLTQVRRFSMTVMFLSSKDKQVIRNLLQSLADSKVAQEDVDKLKKLYEVS